MGVRVLCVGDMHLGRTPGGLGGGLLGELGLELRAVGPREAWERTVELALEERVDALLLAGDVVDAARDYFESYAFLSAGVERLVGAGIRVLGVVGNHDVEVLPRLASRVRDFELVGRGGAWEVARIEGRDGGALEILGWSFPKEHVRESPLLTLGAEQRARTGVPRVGLLHADLDAHASAYAPVRGSELRAIELDAWLLGHVHKPSDLSGERPIGYLGSLSALRASEIGDRGPWLLETHGSGLRLSQRAIAPLRFEDWEIDVSGAEDLVGILERIHVAFEERVAQIERAAFPAPGPRLIGLRGRLVGRTGARGLLEVAARQVLESASVSARRGEPSVFIEGLEIEARTAVDLAASARRADPLGLLAGRLLLLEQPAQDPERRALLDAARPRLEAQASRVLGGALDPPTLSDEDLARWLRRAGDLLLDELLRQEQSREGAT